METVDIDSILIIIGLPLFVVPPLLDKLVETVDIDLILIIIGLPLFVVPPLLDNTASMYSKVHQ